MGPGSLLGANQPAADAPNHEYDDGDGDESDPERVRMGAGNGLMQQDDIVAKLAP